MVVAEAYLRIEVARASRKYPELLTMLEDGSLHLSGLELIARQLDRLDAKERKSVLARAKHRTKREIQELIAELAPKPDVPPKIRRLPEKKPSDDTQLGPDPVPQAAKAQTTSTSESPAQVKQQQPRPEPESKPPVVEPLSPSRYKIQFTASAELKQKLERLAAHMRGVDLASVIEAAVTEKLERVEARRYGKVKKPRTSVADVDVDTTRDIRKATATEKRAVCERDGDQCTYVAPSRKRCPARDDLEFHHTDLYAKGGKTSVDTLTLRCPAHNLYAAEQDYGVEKMRRYRRKGRKADRAGEPAPMWQLGPELVPGALSQPRVANSSARSWFRDSNGPYARKRRTA